MRGTTGSPVGGSVAGGTGRGTDPAAPAASGLAAGVLSGGAPALAPLDPAFGTHALPAPLERLRRSGGRLGTHAAARRIASLIRRVCVAGRPDPFDVEPFPGQRARLHPRDNLSEKRVFAAPQFWDRAERAALVAAMATAPAPFHFVDAGANVGLYTLALRAAGPIRGLAIEPDPTCLARLRANLAASAAAEVTVAPVALSDRAGTARLATPGANRGETALGTTGIEVATRPLLAVVREAGLARIDALKIDVEGEEAAILGAFLHEAPAALRPRLVVVEARRGAWTPALALMAEAGYSVAARTRMNAVLTAPDPET